MDSAGRYDNFFNLPLLSDNMTEQSMSFISNLYSYDDVSRNRVQNIIDSCSNLFKNYPLNTFITGLLQRLEDCGERPENLYHFQKIYDTLIDPFKDLTTEYKRLEAFKRDGTYIPPETIKIEEREDYRNSKGSTALVKIPVTIEFISLSKTLKNFLELPNIFDSIKKYLNTLLDDSLLIQNVVQGDLWKAKKKSFEDKFVLPLVVYHDDYETNNPLGSHRGLAKTGAVYASIPCLPPSLQSKLENIFVILLFNSLDEKDFNYKTILSPLLQELKKLQATGLTIFEKTPSETTIYFALLTVVGDNLAVNAIHGFITSFSGNYCCRFCLMNRSQIKDAYEVDDSLLRTQNQYDNQIKTKNFDSTGIKSPSCFNDLLGYSTIDSMCVDVMHDILEGVCQYDLGKILNTYILKKKFFTLETLNNRVRGFDYGPIEKRNKPPDITHNHIKNECIIISSAEMLCFVRNINLILGDLVPENDDHWSLIIMLKKIVDFTTAKALHKSTIAYFKVLVSEYLKKLLILFPSCLKFKHHVLIHYAHLFLKFGPIWSALSTKDYTGKEKL